MLKEYKTLRSKNAFTLVELLVVIAIIALLVSIVVPAISGALFKGKMTAALANGRGIQQAIFAKDTESIYTTTSAGWPQSADNNGAGWTDASEFFVSMVTNDILNVGWNYFAGPGLPTAPNEADFLAGTPISCMWCIAEDVTDGTAENLPVLFSRNLDIANLNEEDYTAAANGRPANLITTSNPFNDKGFVFITKSGSGYSLFKNDLLVGTLTEPGPFRTLFNVLDNDGAVIDQVVLRPAGDTAGP